MAYILFGGVSPKEQKRSHSFRACVPFCFLVECPSLFSLFFWIGPLPLGNSQVGWNLSHFFRRLVSKDVLRFPCMPRLFSFFRRLLLFLWNLLAESTERLSFSFLSVGFGHGIFSFYSGLINFSPITTAASGDLIRIVFERSAFPSPPSPFAQAN